MATNNSASIVSSLSQEGYIAMKEDITYVINSIADATTNLTSVASLARALAPFGYGDCCDLIETAIAELTSVATDLKQVLAIVSPSIDE